MTIEDDRVAAVLAADRVLRRAVSTLLSADDPRTVVAAIERTVGSLRAANNDDGVVDSLVALAEVLANVQHADANRILVGLLDHAEPMVRGMAGESLMERMYERYAEVLRSIETAVGAGLGATALAEVPFLLAEVGEPGGLAFVKKLLSHADPDVAGAAVEAVGIFGDPSSLPSLESMVSDARTLTAEDEESGDSLTVGELAMEVVNHLRALRSGDRS